MWHFALSLYLWELPWYFDNSVSVTTFLNINTVVSFFCRHKVGLHDSVIWTLYLFCFIFCFYVTIKLKLWDASLSLTVSFLFSRCRISIYRKEQRTAGVNVPSTRPKASPPWWLVSEHIKSAGQSQCFICCFSNSTIWLTACLLFRWRAVLGNGL